MKLTFGILAAIPGTALALPAALSEWMGGKLLRARPWALLVGAGLLAVGLAWRSTFADVDERRFGLSLALPGGTLMLAMVLAWLPSRWQRAGLIAAVALVWYLMVLAGPRRDDDGVWLLVGFALWWAFVSFLRGDVSQPPVSTSADQSPASRPMPNPAFRPQTARRLHLPNRAATLLADQFAALAQQPSTWLRGLLLFLICYGSGALLVAAGVEPLAGLLLRLAGTLPGSAEPPSHGDSAAFAYWLSYGILPVLFMVLLASP